jgi:replicative DNA helicase
MQTDRKVPPQSLESEMSILGGILLKTGAVTDTVLEFIVANDFYREAHRKIFTAMCRLNDLNEPCDLITLSHALKKAGVLEEVGGGAYLATLVDYVPTAANIAYYCKAVAEKALERKLLQAAQDTVTMVHGNKPASEIIEQLETHLTALTAGVEQQSGPVHARDLIRESMRRTEKRCESNGELQGISWGIKDIDEATAGIHKGELIVIAGRPSMGKTALALNVIRSACKAGQSAMLFSLEMSRLDCIDRMIADMGNVKFQHMRTGQLENTEWSKHLNASGKIEQWAFSVDDTPGISLAKLRSRVKKQKRNGLDLAVVDYLQLMGVSAADNRTQAIGAISRGLKQIARELDIAVILLSQLNRSVDSRPDKRPVMSDLRDSGEIEQDADVIIFPFRPAAYCQECRDRVNSPTHDFMLHQSEAQILIEKQRSGERNLKMDVLWIGQHQRFEDKIKAC